MTPHRDDSLLPDDAVWADDGTDPVADAEWLADFHFTDRHYRLYDTYDHRFQTDHPDNRVLFGVVLIDGDDIVSTCGGVLCPSPSMIGHLDSLPPRDVRRHPESPLETYSQTGGSNDAFRFGSDALAPRVSGLVARNRNIALDSVPKSPDFWTSIGSVVRTGCFEVYFSDVVSPSYGVNWLNWLFSGRALCGWQGRFPTGRLLIL